MLPPYWVWWRCTWCSYHVLEKHFRQECLPAQERFWRNVKAMYSPGLETWRPRVNGVQLKASVPDRTCQNIGPNARPLDKPVSVLKGCP